ncbi:unnamed protein product [Nippostrongylus brasiliensis]|uniref:SWIB domain-containing protein n=1 Tax=Nippostrongylus brasiliensis TaxID=27835 RepID=A0A0N4YG93_NIPBR|nr:unnamed protein product [Nippostrongylus brasiliensis]
MVAPRSLTSAPASQGKRSELAHLIWNGVKDRSPFGTPVLSRKVLGEIEKGQLEVFKVNALRRHDKESAQMTEGRGRRIPWQVCKDQLRRVVPCTS